jgi:magnesium-transporting ATPase (P-type)
MEGALLALAGKLSGEGADPYPGWTREDAIPFDAAHRYIAVLVRDAGGHATVQVKGAPKAIIGMCADQRAADGGTARLDPDHWHDFVQRLAADEQRVLALASRSVDAEMTTLEPPDIEGRLTLIGLVGLIDPPRSEAFEAVADCHAAGIRVKMITGDHAATARAIAACIGLKNTNSVLTGNNLDAMDDAAPAATARRAAVERNPDLADPPGLGALRGGGVRHVPLRDRTGVSRRTRTDYGA